MPDTNGLPEELVRQSTYRRNGLAVFGEVDLRLDEDH